MFPKETNILAVDDSFTIRQIIVENLKKMGYQKIDTAGNTNEAMSKLLLSSKTPAPFTLVLSDLNMPGPSGLDFLKQVRSSDKFKDLPFVLITTESEKQSVIQAAMAGVSAYIVKPFNTETLTKRLEEAWKKHHP